MRPDPNRSMDNLTFSKCDGLKQRENTNKLTHIPNAIQWDTTWLVWLWSLVRSWLLGTKRTSNLSLFSVLFHCKLSIFGFWTMGQRKWTIWRRHLGLWEFVPFCGFRGSCAMSNKCAPWVENYKFANGKNIWVCGAHFSFLLEAKGWKLHWLLLA